MSRIPRIQLRVVALHTTSFYGLHSAIRSMDFQVLISPISFRMKFCVSINWPIIPSTARPPSESITASHAQWSPLWFMPTKISVHRSALDVAETLNRGAVAHLQDEWVVQCSHRRRHDRFQRRSQTTCLRRQVWHIAAAMYPESRTLRFPLLRI